MTRSQLQRHWWNETTAMGLVLSSWPRAIVAHNRWLRGSHLLHKIAANLAMSEGHPPVFHYPAPLNDWGQPIAGTFGGTYHAKVSA